jgi:hypothetical protein
MKRKSFLTPALLAIGPVAPVDKTSRELRLPILTKRDFQIRFVVEMVNISVKVLKQSRTNNATSKKN